MQEAAAKKKSFKNCNWLLLAAAAARIYERSPLLVVVQKKVVEIVAFLEKKVFSRNSRIQWGKKRKSSRIKFCCPCPRFTEEKYYYCCG